MKKCSGNKMQKQARSPTGRRWAILLALATTWLGFSPVPKQFASLIDVQMLFLVEYSMLTSHTLVTVIAVT
jgi:hypothetical protein